MCKQSRDNCGNIIKFAPECLPRSSAFASRNPRQVVASGRIPGKKLLKYHFIGSYAKHTDPPYTTVLNIDGQTIVMSDEPVLEDLTGDARNNPEAGTGWKYNLKK